MSFAEVIGDVDRRNTEGAVSCNSDDFSMLCIFKACFHGLYSVSFGCVELEANKRNASVTCAGP